MVKQKIKEIIIVEGKYDKIKLSSFLDGIIIETNGFQIFKDREKMAYIRKMAALRGVLILTDSDGAGLVIRNYLMGSIPKSQIKQAYIPEILGKEKRKKTPSKAGTLGVEGVGKEIILNALRRAGVSEYGCNDGTQPIGKTDLFEDGLNGGENSAAKRQKLLHFLQLPSNLSSNALLQTLNAMMTREEYKTMIQQLFCTGDRDL